MELYLLRHAIAVERRLAGVRRDADRPLTVDGAKKMRRIAKGMRQIGLSFDLILSSPYRRARETAEIVAEIVPGVGVVTFSEYLTPGGTPNDLITEIALYDGKPQNVLLVGHEPCLSNLIALLVSGTPDSWIMLKKGGLCKLSTGQLRNGRCATLNWLLTPPHLIHLK